MDRETFLENHAELIEALRRCPHHPEEKIRLLRDRVEAWWEDKMLIWALEASGEEDVVIEIIVQRLDWDENRVQEALQTAGWSPEKMLCAFYKAMTGIS